MAELCPYTSLYNEPSQWSVFGFLPPNWAWWAWHLIVRPLWKSHHLNTPPWQLQPKILRNNLVKWRTVLSHVAQKLCGDWCVSVYLSRQHSSTYNTMWLRLFLTFYQNTYNYYPSSSLIHQQFCSENRSNKVLMQFLTGGLTHGLIKTGDREKK